MSEQVTYADEYGFKMQVQDPLTEAQARARFDRRGRFVVVLGDPTRPRCFLEMMLDSQFINLCVMDDQGRIGADIGFSPRTKVSPRWFLHQATFRTFDGTTDQALSAMTYGYSPEGCVGVRYDDLRDPMAIRTGRTTGDVSDHWEAPPVFGEWARFAREDRRIARPPVPADALDAHQLAEALRKADKQMRPFLRKYNLGERHGRHFRH